MYNTYAQLSVKQRGIFDWWGVIVSPKDEWSFVTTTPGALSVIMDLELKMQWSYVDNWDFLMKASAGHDIILYSAKFSLPHAQCLKFEKIITTHST